MKFLILFALSSVLLCAQPYGQTKYPGGSVMSSGYQTNIHPQNEGFIMAGLKSSCFHIDKTKSGGSVPSYFGGYSFERDYYLNENGSCSSTPGNGVTPIGGVSAIVISHPNGFWYAVAGVYSQACFISFHAPDGTSSSILTFKFPSPATQLNRPTILQDPGTLDIYVCGSYNSDMYVVKVNSSGSTVWSSFYNAGMAILMEPRDMIISGHTGEIIVVGHMSPDLLT